MPLRSGRDGQVCPDWRRPPGHDLRARVNELGLTETVFFAGFRKDALSLYGDLDLIVLTSVNEGTPLTLMKPWLQVGLWLDRSWWRARPHGPKA